MAPDSLRAPQTDSKHPVLSFLFTKERPLEWNQAEPGVNSGSPEPIVISGVTLGTYKWPKTNG